MKKAFEAPEVEILEFNVEDVITTSSVEEPDPGAGGLPIL